MKSLWQQTAGVLLGMAVLVMLGCSAQAKKEAGKADSKSPESKCPLQCPTKVSKSKMTVQKESWGKTPKDVPIDLYTLDNGKGLRVKIMTYGATIISVETPDRDGKPANITLAMDSLEGYLKGVPYFGATVGRYANRIAKGKFSIDGKQYTLATNNDANHLHGGLRGFDKVVWKAEPIETDKCVGVKFSYESADGEEGYPGKLSAEVTYSITDKDELKMDYVAKTDKTTVLNLTNHTYWNLAGGTSGDILGQSLTLNASKYLPVDDGLIPTGELKDVKDSPMDFTSPHKIGERIAQVKGGYDHCYVLDRKDGEGLSLAARVEDPKSGRVMEILTTQPAIQFYSGNFLDGTLKAGGKSYEKHGGFCLETQHYPDSPNRPEFPSVLLKPGETYQQHTVHQFSVRK